MLIRPHRLRLSDDIRAVRAKGKSHRHPIAILLIAANNKPVSRFGFSASRRVGNAVKRNRAKRLLRESVRMHMADIQTGWDCLFIARQATPVVSFQEVDEAILSLLKRARILDAEGK